MHPVTGRLVAVALMYVAPLGLRVPPPPSPPPPHPPDPSASTYARSLPIRRVCSARGGRGRGRCAVELRPDGGGGRVLREQTARWIFHLSIATKVQRARLGLRRRNFLSFERRPECKYQPGKSTPSSFCSDGAARSTFLDLADNRVTLLTS